MRTRKQRLVKKLRKAQRDYAKGKQLAYQLQITTVVHGFPALSEAIDQAFHTPGFKRYKIKNTRP